MAIHSCYRKTFSSNYIAVGSYIKLPTECNYRVGIDPLYHNYNGGCPEFFHGMYSVGDTVIGVDSGIGYNNGYFQIMVYSYPNMFLNNQNQPQQWFTKRLYGVNKGDIVILRTYLNNNKFITQVDDENGTEIDRLELSCASTSIYNRFFSGVVINRENSLAINQESSSSIACNDTPAVYFKGVEFYRTTLTTTSYAYVPLTDNNSFLSHTSTYAKFTGRAVDFPYYDDSISSTMVGGFIKDTVSATTNSIEISI